MAQLIGNLWEYNLAKVVIVDVTDDYKLMQPPMPSDFYPVLMETWLPRHNLSQHLPGTNLVQGYLYDWHETPDNEDGAWYVGVVMADLANELTTQIRA
ncbi:MAG: hypothetical protein BGO01_04225 [Armatimonadetes bacterium 55-13]|nr:hypothetical protein [Armatimonadota bacterium]OJU63356.1 MAG: hypothetical protein BGO01_04225 [Armatimonadetes bacterium 55-13]